MLKKFETMLELRGYSPHTIKNYVNTVENFFIWLYNGKKEPKNEKKSELKGKLPEWVNKNIKKIKQENIEEYLMYLKKDKNNSNKSINRHLNAIKKFFRINKLETSEEIEFSKIEKSLPEFLTVEEVRSLLDVILNKRDKALFRLLYASGLRVSEAVNLDRDCVGENKILVKQGKGKKDRIVIVDKKTQEIINEYINSRDDDNKALFVNYKKERLSSVSVYLFLKKYAKIAGIKKKVSPHILRHSFATHMLQNGADIVVIKELLGHSNLSTTQIYTHLTNRYIEKIYEKTHPLSND